MQLKKINMYHDQSSQQTGNSHFKHCAKYLDAEKCPHGTVMTPLQIVLGWGSSPLQTLNFKQKKLMTEIKEGNLLNL